MAGTVGELLESQDIEVGEHDVVAPGPETQLTDGTVVAVQFGRQVKVTVDGKPQTYLDHGHHGRPRPSTLIGIDTAGADVPSAGAPGSAARAGRRHRHPQRPSRSTLPARKRVINHRADRGRRARRGQDQGRRQRQAERPPDGRSWSTARLSATSGSTSKVTRRRRWPTRRSARTPTPRQGHDQGRRRGVKGVRTITYRRSGTTGRSVARSGRAQSPRSP